MSRPELSKGSERVRCRLCGSRECGCVLGRPPERKRDLPKEPTSATKWELAFENDDDYPNNFVMLHSSGPIEAASEDDAREKFKKLTPDTFDYYVCWVQLA